MSDANLKPSADDGPIVAGDKPNPLPAGKIIKTDPTKWYYLKVNYTDNKGNPAVDYACPVAKNAATSFWDYVVLGGGTARLRFQPQPADAGWYHWRIHDDDYNAGYHLDCKATGFPYRTNLYNTWWQIVDSRLYCSYWTTGVPCGSAYYSFFVPAGEYIGMGLTPFTCELVEA
ncbi:MAG: hypothetical protein WCE79_00710 [Xanthobacteraceae bacterium]